MQRPRSGGIAASTRRACAAAAGAGLGSSIVSMIGSNFSFRLGRVFGFGAGNGRIQPEMAAERRRLSFQVPAR